VRRLPAITIEAADLPDDVLALLDQHLLDLAGTSSDPNAADPIQYDELRIEHDQGDVEIVVYNRAVLLFTTDSEAVRRIRMEWAGPTGAWVPAARAAPATLRDRSQRRAGRDPWLRWATVRAQSILRSRRLRPRRRAAVAARGYVAAGQGSCRPFVPRAAAVGRQRSGARVEVGRSALTSSLACTSRGRSSLAMP